MVNPILLLVVPLAVAFSLPLADQLGRGVSRALHLLTLAFLAYVAADWWLALYHGHVAAQIITGGWDPPWGINLRFGLEEASLVFIAAATAFASAIYLMRREDRANLRGIIIQMMVVVGAMGLVMTRDLFNVFVFLEITSIGTYAVVAMGREKGALEAGFKYMILGSIASILFLLAVGVLYKWTGTLNLDDMAGRVGLVAHAGLGLALLLLLVAMAIELKLFPVNGPAVDLYDGVEPGVMALLVGTSVNAVVFAFYKIFSLFDASLWTTPVMTLGAVTFVVANFIATRQRRLGRTLGYSSSAQIGLLVFFVPLVSRGIVPLWAAGLLLINHSLAKAGLLWLSGIQGDAHGSAWRNVRGFRGVCATNQRFALVVAVLGITALPPLPGFFGKWFALSALVSHGYSWWLVPILVGSMFELVYYFRLIRQDDPGAEGEAEITDACPLPEREGFWPVLFAMLGLGLGAWLLATRVETIDPMLWLGGGLGVALLLSYFPSAKLPRTVPAFLSLAAVAALAVHSFLGGDIRLDTLDGVFRGIVAVGSVAVALAALGARDLDGRHHGLFVMLVASLYLVVGAQSLLVFFIGWELMTWTSYLLITHAEKAGAAAYRYVLFSGGAGLLVLAGLLVALGAGVTSVAGLGALSGTTALAVWVLLVLGFATKVAAWGVHIWAPDAYSEAPDTMTAFLSGVISKMPVFGFIALVARIGLGSGPVHGVVHPYHVLAWIGAIGAFSMSLWAVFQDDVKKMLAYSSLGQLGYIIVGFALMTPLGWSAALYHSIHHLLFKGLLFLVVAGVIRRTGTRTLHEMGGLIGNMPLSFIGMLVGIIALAGVPPLAGFTGKWLIYQATLDKGWLLLTAFTMFSSLVAFLYLFRMIHGIFLGQRKRAHQTIKEAPWTYGLAQVGLIATILVLSVFPNLVLSPMQEFIAARLGASSYAFVTADLVAGRAGSFNALSMMILVGVLFAYGLVLLLVTNPKVKRVRQLDIGFSAELPPNPEEFHFVAGMFQPYERALKPLLGRWGTRIWGGIVEWIGAIGNGLRRFYTGDAQTYALYAIILVLILAATGVGH